MVCLMIENRIMKRKFLNVFVMSILLVVVLACDSLNSSERLLLGKWKEVSLDDNVKSESITEYKKDRTFCSSMKVENVVNSNDDEIADTLDIRVLIEFRISWKGTWSLKDKALEEDAKTFNIDNIEVKFVGSDVPDDVKDRNDVFESEKRQMYKEWYSICEKDLLGVSSSQVKKLNKLELVTLDEDGETKYQRYEE